VVSEAIRQKRSLRFARTGDSNRSSAIRAAGTSNGVEPASRKRLGGRLLNLFYSRRIGLDEGHEVRILVGGEVTGWTGPLGIMNIEVA
jgi:hypothetical protein